MNPTEWADTLKGFADRGVQAVLSPEECQEVSDHMTDLENLKEEAANASGTD